MKKIGLAIALGKDANSHTQTFIEAINYSLKHFPEFKQNTLKIINDEKSAEGGERAATELIAWGAEVVVGHFSSLAALTALPMYTRNAIPLILPASTACELDKYNRDKRVAVFKYQKNNAALMTHCISDTILNRQDGTVYAIVQNNLYANRMMEQISMTPDIKIIRNIPEKVNKTDSYIIIGYSDFAAKIMEKLTQLQVYRIMLVDDSDSHDVYNSYILRPQRLSRVRSTCYLSKHGMKHPYWNETLLALSFACCINYGNVYDAPSGTSFNTYLGLQDFDKNNRYGDCLLVSEELD